MGSAIDRLLAIGSDPLGRAVTQLPPAIADLAGALASELLAMLRRKNGFFAFESALRVFPATTSNLSVGLDDWNSETLWRQTYGGLANRCLFFAEDIFGGQFCIKDNLVFSFDPETGSLDQFSDSIEKWADDLLVNYKVLTGYPLAHEWQSKNGVLDSEMRLVPKIPFVCGGDFNIENLYAINAVRGMKWRGNLACQIKDMPDGSRIEFKIAE